MRMVDIQDPNFFNQRWLELCKDTVPPRGIQYRDLFAIGNQPAMNLVNRKETISSAYRRGITVNRAIDCVLERQPWLDDSCKDIKLTRVSGFRFYNRSGQIDTCITLSGDDRRPPQERRGIFRSLANLTFQQYPFSPNGRQADVIVAHANHYTELTDIQFMAKIVKRILPVSINLTDANFTPHKEQN